MAREIVHAVGSAVRQGVVTGIWVAAGELAPAKRRAVRVATVASVALIGFGSVREDLEEVRRESAERDAGAGRERPPMDRRRVAVTAAAGLLSVGTIVGRRQLEKRWLARLERSGHAHPYRALAVRLGLIDAALTLPGRLLKPR